MQIFPSIVSSNLLDLKSVIITLDPYVDGWHVDIMDNHFVPNLTLGSDFANAISKSTKLPVDMHLMVDNPETWVDKLELKPNDCFLFHYEATTQIESIIEKIKNSKKGIVINPKTPVEELFDYLDKVDQVLLMSVDPGFSGQKFIPSVLGKLEIIVSFRKKHNLSFLISMDGGINADNIKTISEKGCDRIGAASSIFGEVDPVKSVERLRKLAE